MEFIQQNILLVILAVTSGAMLLATGFGIGGPRVTTSEATNLINREDAQVIDVRDAAEFAGGHLIGARNIPVAKFGERAADLEKMKGKPVIVCCETGIRSGRAARELKKLGIERAVNLDGGLAAWRKAGLPLTSKGERK
ncbi:MAG: rhodanese-like domain-containing protein [Rhodocyclaceae bacterium]|nr:rhodanese-like domain-containing protein [Rhodocyclaceae bacterium]